MIQDLLVSFKDNIKTKTTNPFLGTMILVWIFKNWNLLYSLFNFEPDTTLVQKREFIVNYFTDNPIIENLLWCVFESFIILIATYFFINLARLIVNLYDKRLTPLIYKWTDDKSIVLKSIYDISENERKRLEKKLEEERDSKLKIQNDYERLEKRLSDLLSDKEEINTTKDVDNRESQEQENDQLKNKLDLIFKKLQKENKVESFEKISSNILNGYPFEKSTENVEEFTSIGLIIPNKYESNNRYSYKLTSMGNILHEKLVFEKLK